MKISKVRELYISYFEDKAHKKIESASLIPKDDPTTLYTGSGMQPLLPYFLGKDHPRGKRLVDSQKCFRAEDIDEVGDNRHTTSFEMLGNWSLGDYFKKEQLAWVFDFLINKLKVDPQKIYVTVFIGDKKNNIPKDTESVSIWKELFRNVGVKASDVEIGSEEDGSNKGMQGGRIFYYDSSKNWWSRAGVPENMPSGEPGGPDSEIFYEFTEVKHDKKFGEKCHPNCDCGRFLEIGNSVFMEYIKNSDGSFSPLPQKNVDFGGGLERLTAAAIDSYDMFKIDTLANIIKEIERITGIAYSKADDKTKKAFRILSDHIKSATFILSEGIKPSNLGRGYVLRRLIRRSVRYAKLAGIFEEKMCSKISKIVISDYEDHYPELRRAESTAFSELDLEEIKFLKTLDSGIREFEKLALRGGGISGKEAFMLFASHGFPLEMTLEMAKEDGITVDEDGFLREFEKHQKISKADVEKRKFEGGLADKSDPIIIQYHTTAHLLLSELREVLGTHVHQKGANITSERLRFDFSHSEKMTDEEKQKVEEWVNKAIGDKLPVISQEMSPDEARNSGAEGEFSSKYGDKITVYTVGGELGSGKEVSAEICGGPHVKNLSEIKGKFRIKKEESSSAGVRRIKAVLE